MAHPRSSLRLPLPFAIAGIVALASACGDNGTTVNVGGGTFAGGFTVSHNVILTGGIPAPQNSKPYLDTLTRYSPVQPQPAQASATPVPMPGGSK